MENAEYPMSVTNAGRRLSITLQADWQNALRDAARAAYAADGYLGETLNFDSPAAFFGQLTEKRWALIHTVQTAGELAVRELARRVGRDVKRVHEDAGALVKLGIFERTASGGVRCPFVDIHVDMHLRHAA
jgi:predicted transcriptional regulator